MFLVKILGEIMCFCYNLCKDYGVAIILFTLISKVILFPMSIWVQKNSIKMVKMQPDINKIKIQYFGDKDKIAEEEDKLYKKEKYNAFASLVPLAVQILLLLGLVNVIYHPLTYIVKMDKNDINNVVEIALQNHRELTEESSSIELSVVNDIKDGKDEPYLSVIKNAKDIASVRELNLKFFGFDLSWVATEEQGIAFLIPIIAGISALLLCIGQNIMNVLQAEQSNLNKYGMMALSVGLSLYLGAFVPAGVALYWTASNLFAIFQQWLLNIMYDPKKSVNYEELEKTRVELKEMNSGKNEKRTKEQKRKEKEDYKKFFKVVNKHLVFYSESNGFYKYYKSVIEYILNNTNLTIHYITSDFNDKIFELEKTNSKIKAYYIGEKKLITLMMKLDSDVVVMTMPDLENYHIKRSYLRKDINYIYMPHGMDSLNLTMRKGSMDHFDSLLLTGKPQVDEALETEKVYKLSKRNIVKCGYPLFDDMLKGIKLSNKNDKNETILIAPSWQKDNIIDLCLEDILNSLSSSNYKIIVRPHPQQVRHMKEYFEKLKEKYSNNKNIIIQTDFSATNTVFESSLLITDWSAIAYEFAFTTKRPVISIETPMKIMNPEYKKIKTEPFNIWARKEIGQVVKLDDINSIKDVVDKSLKNKDKYKNKINKLIDENVYNVGSSAEVAGDYIIEVIMKKIKERKGSK